MNGDRLVRLSMTGAALSDTTSSTRPSPAELRGRPEPDRRALVDRAVSRDRADVIAALRSLVDWHAAELQTGPSDRLLVIDGREPVVYRADDPEGERRAWAAIRAAMRPRPRQGAD